MRWQTGVASMVVMLTATFARADDGASVVRLVGDEAVLEVERDDWVPLCHSPCRVVLLPEDATRALRVRSPRRTEYVHAIAGELVVDVGDHHRLHTGLAIGAGVLVAGSLAMFGAAFYTFMSHFELPIGCDDFTGTADAASYPNGKTCSSRPSPAGTYALVGLGLLAGGAAVGGLAVALPSSRISVAPAVGRDGASATLAWRF